MLPAKGEWQRMNGRIASGNIYGATSKGSPGIGIALLFAAWLPLLGGCSTAMAPSLAPVLAQVSITTDELVGNWGLASYRAEKDLARTRDEARRACSNPYVVTRGTTGG